MAAPEPIALPAKERAYLRELARKQAGYAALPVMERRRRMWLDLNTGRSGARPPAVVEIARREIDRIHGHRA
jgi:hypothetical protein